MRRRELVTLVGGAAALPLAALAQQGERMRHIGLLLPARSADDPEFQARIGAFLQGLALSGWTVGRNVQLEYRWAGTNPDDIRATVAVPPPARMTSGLSATNSVACLRITLTRA